MSESLDPPPPAAPSQETAANQSVAKRIDFSIEGILSVPYRNNNNNNNSGAIKNYCCSSLIQELEDKFSGYPDHHRPDETHRAEFSGSGHPQGLIPSEDGNEGQHRVNPDSDEQSKQDFSWLYCSRFKPPKLPRSKKRSNRKRYGRGPRIPFAAHQITVLENAFKKSHYLSPDCISRLAESLYLSETRVKIWFQNRRARFRREQEVSLLESSRDHGREKLMNKQMSESSAEEDQAAAPGPPVVSHRTDPSPLGLKKAPKRRRPNVVNPPEDADDEEEGKISTRVPTFQLRSPLLTTTGERQQQQVSHHFDEPSSPPLLVQAYNDEHSVVRQSLNYSISSSSSSPGSGFNTKLFYQYPPACSPELILSSSGASGLTAMDHFNRILFATSASAFVPLRK